MKQTGIVRRIDDLGRIVIPKEIRRSMHMNEGDPLEIYVGNDEIIFRKYSLIGELGKNVMLLCESLYKEIKLPTAICDLDEIVCIYGLPKQKTNEIIPSNDLIKTIKERKIFQASDDKEIKPFLGLDCNASIIIPIICNGDLIGGLIVIESDSKVLEPVDLRLSRLTADIISRQFEKKNTITY